MRKSLDRALVSLLVAGLLLCLALLQIAWVAREAHALAPAYPLAVLTYLCVGIGAWHGRPNSRIGPIVLASGLAIFLAALGYSELPMFQALSAVAASLPLATTIHLLLAFPTGVLKRRSYRITVFIAYFISTALQAPAYLFSGEGVLSIGAAPNLVAAVSAAQWAIGGAVFIATAALLIIRLLNATNAERRVILPLYLYGLFAAASLMAAPRLLPKYAGLSMADVGVFQLIVLTLLPLAFGLAITRGGIARTAEIEALGDWLNEASEETHHLTQTLRSVIGDPSIEIWFRSPQSGDYIRASGEKVSVHHAGPGRGVHTVHVRDQPVGAIVYDEALTDDVATIHAAGRAIAASVERERLTALLRASQSDLQRSREHLLDISDQERRRIAQDLHDGLQGELVLLALSAGQLAHASKADPDVAARANSLRIDIDRSASNLRNLVHQVMPAPLLQRGLTDAIGDLTDRMPIPTRLRLDNIPGVLSPIQERTAYFVVSEALTNVVKHSNARTAEVALEHRQEQIVITVQDDGSGGANPGQGFGLVGVRERLDVLGGALTIESPSTGGTRLTAEVPL